MIQLPKRTYLHANEHQRKVKNNSIITIRHKNMLCKLKYTNRFGHDGEKMVKWLNYIRVRPNYIGVRLSYIRMRPNYIGVRLSYIRARPNYIGVRPNYNTTAKHCKDKLQSE